MKPFSRISLCLLLSLSITAAKDPSLNPLDALMKKGASLYTQGKYKASETAYTRLLTESPKHWQALCQRGETRRAMGLLSGGLNDVNASIVLNPRHLYSYYIRSLILYGLGNTEAAISDFYKAKPDPQYEGNPCYKHHEINLTKARQAEGIFKKGKSIFQQKNYSQALVWFQNAINLNPNHVEALFHKGSCHYQLGQYKQGIQTYVKFLKRKSSHSDAYMYLGECYRATGKLSSALTNINRAIQYNPKNRYAYYIRSLIHYGLGHIKSSISDFKKGKDHPLYKGNVFYKKHAHRLKEAQQSQGVFEKALQYYRKKNYKTALTLYEATLLLYPHHTNALYQKASCHYQLGQYARGVQAYTRFLTQKSSHPGGFRYRAECYRAMGNLSGALQNINRSLRYDPKNRYSYFLRSIIRLRLKKIEKAKKDYIKAKPFAPKNPSFLSHERKLSQWVKVKEKSGKMTHYRMESFGSSQKAMEKYVVYDDKSKKIYTPPHYEYKMMQASLVGVAWQFVRRGGKIVLEKVKDAIPYIAIERSLDYMVDKCFGSDDEKKEGEDVKTVDFKDLTDPEYEAQSIDTFYSQWEKAGRPSLTPGSQSPISDLPWKKDNGGGGASKFPKKEWWGGQSESHFMKELKQRHDKSIGKSPSRPSYPSNPSPSNPSLSDPSGGGGGWVNPPKDPDPFGLGGDKDPGGWPEGGGGWNGKSWENTCKF